MRSARLIGFILIMLNSLTGESQVVWSGANNTNNCVSGTANTWLTANNWCMGRYPNSNEVAQFSTNGTASTVSINFNNFSPSYSYQLGGISVLSDRSNNLVLNCSANAFTGILYLNGQTINGLQNVILNNSSKSDLTITNYSATYQMDLNLNNNSNNVINVDNTGKIYINSDIYGASKILTKTGAGTLILAGDNNSSRRYNGGTVIEDGKIVLANSRSLAMCDVTFKGGVLETGIPSGDIKTTGRVILISHSKIILGNAKHSISFAISSNSNWTANQVLIIEGWLGTPGYTGTAGNLFVGTSSTAISPAQLSQIKFKLSDGYHNASIMTTGELVPTGNAIDATATYRSKKSGDFSDPTIWEMNIGGSYYVDVTTPPSATNNVIISAGHTVKL